MNIHGSYKCIESHECPSKKFYRKLMTTDEFGYRQITTNMCRKKRCRKIAQNQLEYSECRQLPLSVSYHYIDITSGLKTPTDILRIALPKRRRRQRYYFKISEGDSRLFGIRQPYQYMPHAYLVLNHSIQGPGEYTVHVDMRTYNRKMQMRDNRMLTILIIVSPYEF